MLKLILKQFKNRTPVITILMILSCIISTVPQFVLKSIYSEATSRIYGIDNVQYIFLPYFTHSPNILIQHLIGNILIFLIFGFITEIIIGSRKISFIYLLTFFSTSLINNLHSTNKVAGHGASGICWGLNVFFIFILIILYESKGKRIFRDIYVVFSIFLLILSVFGIPIIEVVYLKYNFYQNFGQTLHLVSMIVVIPFIFIWRKTIEKNTKSLLNSSLIEKETNKIGISRILIVLLIIINLYGTIRMVVFLNGNDSFLGSIEPTNNTKLVDIERIVVNFKKPMENNSEKWILKSINYETEICPEIYTKWINSKKMEIFFSRKFIEKETLHLEFKINQKINKDITMERDLILDYK